MMPNKIFKIIFFQATISLIFFAVSIVGCVKKPAKDTFKEQWEVKESKSEGFSLPPIPRKTEFSKAVVGQREKTDKKTPEQTKKLPNFKIASLKMYNTNIVTVLRALARIAGQNVIFSSSIPGTGPEDDEKHKKLLVNIDVHDAPWNEVFEGLLSSNKLTYKVNGDIITVMKLEDLKEQNDIEAETAKASLGAKIAKKTQDEYETCKIQINYSELSTIASTVSRL